MLEGSSIGPIKEVRLRGPQATSAWISMTDALEAVTLEGSRVEIQRLGSGAWHPTRPAASCRPVGDPAGAALIDEFLGCLDQGLRSA
jgi:hypothetical protein